MRSPARGYLLQSRFDAINAAVCIVGHLVFPDTQHLPPGATQLPDVASVTLAVPLDLGFPERREPRAPSGESPPMPEIPINENGNLCAREDHVRPTGQIHDIYAVT
jgi:hypothetical protein